MKEKLIKQLECLYAWRDFYHQNGRYQQENETIRQIAALKIKYEME